MIKNNIMLIKRPNPKRMVFSLKVDKKFKHLMPENASKIFVIKNVIQ
jgi:hypothetical protein